MKKKLYKQILSTTIAAVVLLLIFAFANGITWRQIVITLSGICFIVFVFYLKNRSETGIAFYLIEQPIHFFHEGCFVQSSKIKEYFTSRAIRELIKDGYITRLYEISGYSDELAIVVNTLHDEKRSIELLKDQWIKHPEGFTIQIDYFMDGGMLLCSDSDGQYRVHKSEIGVLPDDFFSRGKPIT